MSVAPESAAEWVLTDLVIAEEVEVLPDPHASFSKTDPAGSTTSTMTAPSP